MTITVHPVNDPPVARDDEATTPDRTPVTIDVLANDADPDGDALAVTATGSAGWGSVTVDVSGQLTYTPDVLGVLASAVARLGLDDGLGGSLMSKLGAFVNELEGLKRGRRLTAAVADALIAQARAVMAGVLAGFLTDAFTYTVGDGHGGFATATVTVRVLL